jgi:hypothetical protein
MGDNERDYNARWDSCEKYVLESLETILISQKEMQEQLNKLITASAVQETRLQYIARGAALTISSIVAIVVSMVGHVISYLVRNG